MDFSADEYLGTLGGSLMKDLLADLQVGDEDFSLEHLEQELAQLDNSESALVQPQSNLPFNAASLVVSHAQEQQGSYGNAFPVAAAPPGQGLDAWSLSLQNFTSLSLQDDFLAADSARKQQQASNNNNRRINALDGAADYDIVERPAIVPPPGLGAPPGVSPPPNPRTFPRTPQNSLAIQEEDAGPIRDDLMKSLTEEFKSVPSDPPVQTASVPTDGPGLTPPAGLVPPQGAAPVVPGMPVGIAPPQGVPREPVMPLPGVIPTQQQQPKPPPTGPPLGVPVPRAPMSITPGVPPATMQPVPMPPVAMPPVLPGGVPPPVLLAVPAGGPAWQTRPPMTAPVPKPPPIFCNPHPAAPPIPGTVLESKFMSARDVTYVVHSLLKPVLVAGVSEDDYHIQYFLRMGGHQANPRKPKHAKDMNKEMTSRENRSKEWSSEKGTLGYVAKSNVARPRALIATPQQTTEQDSEHKQRASLWKARVYCDQGYQSFHSIVEILRKSPPGSVPPEVQIHVAKLMKCMGITMVDKEYQIETESLKLLVKLSKGQALIARALDASLFPPKAVILLIPTLTEILFTNTQKNDDPAANDRLFRSVCNVVQRVSMPFVSLLNCLNIIQKGGKASLSSEARMAYAHIILRKGAFELSQNPSPENAASWGQAEKEFATLLG